MKKTLLMMMALILLGPHAAAKVIDNFNNDSSLSDDANSPDASWWYVISDAMQSTFVFQINSDVTEDGTPNMYCSYAKTSGAEWTYLMCDNLMGSGNAHNFGKYTKVTADVYGSVRLLIKFVDTDSKETADVGTVAATNVTGWTRVEWDISKLDWREADRSRINRIMVFFAPGEIASGSFRLDNLALEPDPDQFTIRNLLLDDFNRGSETNKFDGTGRVWPESAKDKVLKTYYFDAEPGQVHGRAGKSLQFWYGETAGDMVPADDYFGYLHSLNEKNIANYGAVSFWVNGTNGGETFEFGLKDTNGLEKKVGINNYIQYEVGDTRNGLEKDAWRKVYIPFSAFIGLDYSCMDLYSITFAPFLKGMIFIDDILFHQFAWMNLLDFESGNIGNVNEAGGYQGTLGKGTFSFENSNVNSGAYSGKIYSGTEGLVDDFDNGGNNYWGGSNQNHWNNPHNIGSTATYTNSEYYGSAGQSLEIEFNYVNPDSASRNTGIVMDLITYQNLTYDDLSFWVKSTVNGLDFHVGLRDNFGHEPKVNIKSYISAGATGTWQEVKIKLSDFLAKENGWVQSGVNAITVSFAQDIDSVHTSGTLYIDNIEFGRNGAWISVNGTNVSNYDSLVFYLKGNAGGEEVRVKIQDAVGSVHNSNEVTVTATAGWVRQKINLSEFSGVDKTKLNAIHMALFPDPASPKTVYVDDIQLGDKAAAPPVTPTSFKSNGELVASGMVLGPRNLMSANASSYTSDKAMEGVRFEYSLDGIEWKTISTDYDTDNSEYAAGWNASGLVGQKVSARAVAQNIIGKDSANNLEFSDLDVESQEVFVYPNPYYPFKGSKNIHFVNIVTDGVLKVYTISGELVVTLKDDGLYADENYNDGMITWDGKSSDGSLMASGIYLFMLMRDGARVSSGKFVVIK
ncbi:MAG: hypothetical protein ABII64_02675 [Elusimicrobiota bacterium]